LPPRKTGVSRIVAAAHRNDCGAVSGDGRLAHVGGIDLDTLASCRQECVDRLQDQCAEFLAAIKHRSAIPGGTCEFDLPDYYFWLSQPDELRMATFVRWQGLLRPLCDAIAELLWLTRQNGRSTREMARGGVFNINFDRETCRWSILGEAAEVQRSGERQRVLTALGKVSDGMSVGEIVAAASLVSRNAADNLLFHMLRDGEVSRVKRGVYSLPGVAMTKDTAKIAKKQRSELNTLKDQGDFGRSHNPSDLSKALHRSPDNDGLDIPDFLRRTQ
jgi:hypothetical protein